MIRHKKMPTPFNNTSQFRQDLNQSFKWQSLAQMSKVFYENKQFVAETVKNDRLSLLQRAQQERVFQEMVEAAGIEPASESIPLKHLRA